MSKLPGWAKKGCLILLGLILVVSLIVGIMIARLLQPEQLARLVLDQLQTQTGLDLQFEGTPEYAFRPEPRLLLPNFRAQLPDDTAPLFSAKQVELQMPWATLRGGPLTITRMSLDSPVLDLPRLRRWLATRPASQSALQIPSLTNGLTIRQGKMIDSDWRLDGLDISLPALADQQPAQLDVRARFTYREKAHPLKLTLNATPSINELQLVLDNVSAEFTSDDPLPEFSANGRVKYGDVIELDLQGKLQQWQPSWPALPPPLSENTKGFDYVLSYAGSTALDGPIAVKLMRDDIALDTRFVWPELAQWIDTGNVSTLPPVQGTLRAPRIDINGAVLSGVNVQINDEEEPAPVTQDKSQ